MAGTSGRAVVAARHKGGVEVGVSTRNRRVAPAVQLMVIHVPLLAGGPWTLLVASFFRVLGVVETVVTPLPVGSDSSARQRSSILTVRTTAVR